MENNSQKCGKTGQQANAVFAVGIYRSSQRRTIGKAMERQAGKGTAPRPRCLCCLRGRLRMRGHWMIIVNGFFVMVLAAMGKLLAVNGMVRVGMESTFQQEHDEKA